MKENDLSPSFLNREWWKAIYCCRGCICLLSSGAILLIVAAVTGMTASEAMSLVSLFISTAMVLIVLGTVMCLYRPEKWYTIIIFFIGTLPFALSLVVYYHTYPDGAPILYPLFLTSVFLNMFLVVLMLLFLLQHRGMREHAQENNNEFSNQFLSLVNSLNDLQKAAEITKREFNEYFQSVRCKDEESIREKQSILGELLLLKDHLEIMEGGGEGGKEAWIRKKIDTILQSAGVREIPVKPGEEFNGEIHKYAGSEGSSYPEGAVVRVIRKGYVLEDNCILQGSALLRYSEVVVSKKNNESAHSPTGSNESIHGR